MKQGLELFKVRTANFVDIEALEKKFKIVIPPIYRLFIQNFEEEISVDRYFHPISNRELKCNAIKFINDDGGIDDDDRVTFKNFGKTEESLEMYFSGNHYWDELYDEEGDLLPIGSSQSSDIFALGFKGKRKDQIIMFDELHPDGLWKVSDNIFEFIRRLRLVELNSLYHNKQYSQLYKNWGEDFWRIRGEKEES